CFKCQQCKRTLSFANYVSENGEIYCQSHKPKETNIQVSTPVQRQQPKVSLLSVRVGMKFPDVSSSPSTRDPPVLKDPTTENVSIDRPKLKKFSDSHIQIHAPTPTTSPDTKSNVKSGLVSERILAFSKVSPSSIKAATPSRDFSSQSELRAEAKLQNSQRSGSYTGICVTSEVEKGMCRNNSSPNPKSPHKGFWQLEIENQQTSEGKESSKEVEQFIQKVLDQGGSVADGLDKRFGNLDAFVNPSAPLQDNVANPHHTSVISQAFPSCTTDTWSLPQNSLCAKISELSIEIPTAVPAGSNSDLTSPDMLSINSPDQESSPKDFLDFSSRNSQSNSSYHRKMSVNQTSESSSVIERTSSFGSDSSLASSEKSHDKTLSQSDGAVILRREDSSRIDTHRRDISFENDSVTSPTDDQRDGELSPIELNDDALLPFKHRNFLRTRSLNSNISKMHTILSQARESEPLYHPLNQEPIETLISHLQTNSLELCRLYNSFALAPKSEGVGVRSRYQVDEVMLLLRKLLEHARTIISISGPIIRVQRLRLACRAIKKIEAEVVFEAEMMRSDPESALMTKGDSIKLMVHTISFLITFLIIMQTTELCDAAKEVCQTYDIQKDKLIAKPAEKFRINTLGEQSHPLDNFPMIQVSSSEIVDPVELTSYYADYRLEHVDEDAEFYRTHFVGKDHRTYIAKHESRGPIIISIINESGDDASGGQYRAIIRQKETADVRLVFPASEISASSSSVLKRSHTKQILHLLKHYFSPAKPVKISDSAVEKSILTVDELSVVRKYKIGVLYTKAGQTTEEEMFCNEHGSENFNTFLDVLGTKSELKGFAGYSAGLDVKNGQTGTQTVHTKWRNFEITYHVSTLLPYFPEDPQQIQRKRHIGNDLVCIVFMEGENGQFDPSLIRSQFLHIYIIVTLEKMTEINSRMVPLYRVMVTSSAEVCPFGPHLPSPPLFLGEEALREFLLAKVINGENAAYKAPKFSRPHVRTRNTMIENIGKEFLDDYNKTESNTETYHHQKRLSLMITERPSSPSTGRRTSLFPSLAGLTRRPSSRFATSSANSPIVTDTASLQVTIPKANEDGSPTIPESPSSHILSATESTLSPLNLGLETQPIDNKDAKPTSSNTQKLGTYQAVSVDNLPSPKKSFGSLLLNFKDNDDGRDGSVDSLKLIDGNGNDERSNSATSTQTGASKGKHIFGSLRGKGKDRSNGSGHSVLGDKFNLKRAKSTKVSSKSASSLLDKHKPNDC
ncbi:signal-induced proliferation-associated 1-like protein 3, partial [Nowakowskiella sp. JEL0407]